MRHAELYSISWPLSHYLPLNHALRHLPRPPALPSATDIQTQRSSVTVWDRQVSSFFAERDGCEMKRENVWEVIPRAEIIGL